MSETEIGNVTKVAVRVKMVHRESTMQKNSNKVYKMKKAYYKKMRDVRNRDMLIWLTYNRYLKKQQNPPKHCGIKWKFLWYQKCYLI